MYPSECEVCASTRTSMLADLGPMVSASIAFSLSHRSGALFPFFTNSSIVPCPAARLVSPFTPVRMCGVPVLVCMHAPVAKVRVEHESTATLTVFSVNSPSSVGTRTLDCARSTPLATPGSTLGTTLVTVVTKLASGGRYWHFISSTRASYCTARRLAPRLRWQSHSFVCFFLHLLHVDKNLHCLV